MPPTSPVIGRRISAIGLPAGALFIAISRSDEFVVPNGQTEILADDALLVLADAENARDIERIALSPHDEV